MGHRGEKTICQTNPPNLVASYPLDGLGHEKVPVPDLGKPLQFACYGSSDVVKLMLDADISVVQKDPLTPKQNSASSLINHRPHPAGVLDGHSTRDRSMPPESHTVFTPCIDAVSHDPRYGYRMKGALPNSMYTPRSPSSMVPTQELLAKMVEHIPYNDIRLQEIISESGGRNNAEGHTSADAQDTELGYGENYRW